MDHLRFWAEKRRLWASGAREQIASLRPAGRRDDRLHNHRQRLSAALEARAIRLIEEEAIRSAKPH